jgi:sucrose-phosphate synthase
VVDARGLAVTPQKLYVFMLSVHGLVRGESPELGRDADTGGQVTYVIELARALGRHPLIDRLDLATRLIEDPGIAADYRRAEEPLGPNARIVRFPFGPRRYVRKELLWNHLDQLVDRCLVFFRTQGRLPDVIHSHYADAGYVGHHLSLLLGVPLVHTGHSLGRCKLKRLLEAGRKPQALEREFNFARRIAAEEATLEHASLVVTSTRQELRDQYGMYSNFRGGRALVIPPGTDVSRFSPPGWRQMNERVRAMIERFLSDPDKPVILALARPDERKNLRGLVAAHGESPELQAAANLAIVAGTREDVRQADEAARTLFTELFLDIDRYDLWGKIAIPKRHDPEDVPELYRYAVQRRGVFANPALTEPFGLTLIEAAACGLPIVATQDGGPQDIVANCRNGLLIDPLDTAAMGKALLEALADKGRYRAWARNGLAGVRRHYTWEAHVQKYLKVITKLLRKERKRVRREMAIAARDRRSPLISVKHVLVSDIDNTLVGDAEGLRTLVAWLQDHAHLIGFAVATGRSLEGALRVLRENGLGIPDVLVTAVGTEIHYGPDPRPDLGWAKHIRHLWRRDAVVDALRGTPGLRLQARENQREFKVSYNVAADAMPSLEELEERLHARDLHVQLVYSHEAYLDVLPVRASKGQAIRYLAYKWGLPLQAFLVAGDSGNDREMLVGDTLGVVVGNHSPELEGLRGLEQIYFAERGHAWGILEGIARYRFAGGATLPATA